MIKALISDIAWVLLFPTDKAYTSSLNNLHKEKSINPDYKFLDHFEFNIELLEYYKSLKGKVGLYIFTSETIQDAPELQPNLQSVFEKVYSASKLGISKKDPNAYKFLVNDIQLQPEETLFIDDTQTNIDAAKLAGLDTILYKDNHQVITDISEKLNT
jgi:FMN phosphatase YigB (HAD superfamily)